MGTFIRIDPHSLKKSVMFQNIVQPPIISLFSSTSSDCLSLFSVQVDPNRPSESFIHILEDDTSLPLPSPTKTMIGLMKLDRSSDEEEQSNYGFSISSPVLHIQSPTLPSTFILCPPIGWRNGAMNRERDLGIKLGWLHLQVRNLGKAWSFEVGVVDPSSHEGRIRCSTFQVSDSPPEVDSMLLF